MCTQRDDLQWGELTWIFHWSADWCFIPVGGGGEEQLGYIPQIRCWVFFKRYKSPQHSTAHNGQVLPNSKGISTQVMKRIDKATKSGNRGMSIAANAYLQYTEAGLLKEALSHRVLAV